MSTERFPYELTPSHDVNPQRRGYWSLTRTRSPCYGKARSTSRPVHWQEVPNQL